jgi:hypothetical protein
VLTHKPINNYVHLINRNAPPRSSHELLGAERGRLRGSALYRILKPVLVDVRMSMTNKCGKHQLIIREAVSNLGACGEHSGTRRHEWEAFASGNERFV